MQNFRAKPAHGDARRRLSPTTRSSWPPSRPRGSCSGPRMHVQAPPNLSDPAQRLRLLDAGIDDWGGVSPRHAGPREPREAVAVDRGPRATTAARGKTLRERLTVYPEFVARPRPVPRRQDACAGRGAARRRRPGARGPASSADRVAGPRCPLEATHDRTHVREGERRRPPRGRCDGLRRDGHAGSRPRRGLVRRVAPERLDGEIRAALAKAEARRPISDDDALALFRADGDALDALCAVADGLRARGGRRRRDVRRQPQHQLHERLLRRMPLLRVRPARGRRGVLHAHPHRGRRPSRGSVGARVRPRCACRGASTPTCRARSTSTSSTR